MPRLKEIVPILPKHKFKTLNSLNFFFNGNKSPALESSNPRAFKTCVPKKEAKCLNKNLVVYLRLWGR